MSGPERGATGGNALTGWFMRAALPFRDTLTGYNPGAFKADLTAALTVAVVALPQCMAYAVIAGVHPKYGLWAATIPVIVASLWGASRFLIAGPTNAIAMLLFSSLAEVTVDGTLISALPEERKMAFIFGVAVLAGLMQIVMGLARLGELVHFISHSVVVGFTAGAGVLIAAGQLKNLFGLSIPPVPDFPSILWNTVKALPQTNIWSLAVGLATMAAALALVRLSPRIPAAFLSIVLAAAVSWLLGLSEHGVRLVGEVPRSLPPLSTPPAPDAEAMRALFMPALAIALLGIVEALSIAKTLASAKGEQIDGNQEFLGQGLANVAAGLFSGIPGSGSFTRSAVNFMAGARTRMAGVLTGLLTLTVVMLLAPLARHIPIAALAGILLIIAWNMIDKHGIALSLRATRADRAVLLATFAATLLLDLEKAVFVGVLLSIALFLRKVSHPQVIRLDNCDSPELASLPTGPCCRNIAVYQIEGALFFGAVDELESRLYEYEDFGHHVVILHLKHVHHLDATGVHAFTIFLKRCRKKGVVLILAGARPGVRKVLADSGLAAALGPERLVATLAEAIELTYAKHLKDHVCKDCKEGNDGECLRMTQARAAAAAAASQVPERA